MMQQNKVEQLFGYKYSCMYAWEAPILQIQEPAINDGFTTNYNNVLIL